MAEVAASSPRFTVLLPTHNRADVLGFAVRSVLAQTFTDFELLIAGDGCTDGTAAVVAEFADPRVRWFDFPKGPGFGYANRNAAMKEARGGLVAFMAHDDLWFPDHLALMRPLFDDAAVEVAYSRPLWFAPEGTISPSAFNLHDPATLAVFLARERSSLPALCFVCRRRSYAQHGGFDATLPQAGDLDLWARIIESGNCQNFAYLPTPTGFHFQANWRSVFGPGELVLWRRLHDKRYALPAALRLPLAPGASEQETAWRAITEAPEAWVADVRAGVIDALDIRVSMADALLLEGQAGFGADQVWQIELAPAFIALKASLDAERRSVGYRVVVALRALAAELLPPFSWRGRVYTRVLKVLDRLGARAP